MTGLILNPQPITDDMTDVWRKYKFNSSNKLEISIPIEEGFNYLFSGRYYIDPTQEGIVFGADYIRMSVLDNEKNPVLVKVEEYVTKCNQWVGINESIQSRTKIPSGFYICLEYISDPIPEIPIQVLGTICWSKINS